MLTEFNGDSRQEIKKGLRKEYEEQDVDQQMKHSRISGSINSQASHRRRPEGLLQTVSIRKHRSCIMQLEKMKRSKKLSDSILEMTELATKSIP